jgi:hypothetical protein
MLTAAMQEVPLIIDPALLNLNWIVRALHAAILTNAHLLTPMLSPPRSVERERTSDYVCRWEARLDRRLILLILKTRSPGVLPSSWPIEATLSEYRIGQDVNSRIQAAG